MEMECTVVGVTMLLLAELTAHSAISDGSELHGEMCITNSAKCWLATPRLTGERGGRWKVTPIEERPGNNCGCTLVDEPLLGEHKLF